MVSAEGVRCAGRPACCCASPGGAGAGARGSCDGEEMIMGLWVGDYLLCREMFDAVVW